MRGGCDTKPQTVRPIQSIAHGSRAAREGRRRSRGASFHSALAGAHVAHSGSTAAWLLERDPEISARLRTAQVAGRWLGVTRAVCRRLRVVLGHTVVVSGPFRPPSSSFNIPR